MKLLLLIELSDKTKKEITDQLSDLKKTYPQFQWEPVENYNILVHSFGEFSDKKSTVGKLETALFDKKIFYFYAYEVSLTIQNKITLFLDFRREKEVERISKNIRELFSLNQSSEKFIPRLTIAKYKIPSKQQYFVIKKRLTNLDIDLSFKVNRLSLFEGEKRTRVFKLI